MININVGDKSGTWPETNKKIVFCDVKKLKNREDYKFDESLTLGKNFTYDSVHSERRYYGPWTPSGENGFIPVAGFGYALIANKSEIESRNITIPLTIDELISECSDLSSNGISKPLQIQSDNTFDKMRLLWGFSAANGASNYSDLSQNAIVSSITTLQNLFEYATINANKTDVITSVMSGSSIFGLVRQTTWRDASDNERNAIGLHPMPKINSKYPVMIELEGFSFGKNLGLNEREYFLTALDSVFEDNSFLDDKVKHQFLIGDTIMNKYHQSNVPIMPSWDPSNNDWITWLGRSGNIDNLLSESMTITEFINLI